MSRYPCDTKVYVGDLGNHARKNELEDSFSYYGPLRSVWIARNPPGFAFVEFESARDAEDAVRGLDGRIVNNSLKIIYYISKGIYLLVISAQYNSYFSENNLKSLQSHDF